jgi:hypothetical protein
MEEMGRLFAGRRLGLRVGFNLALGWKRAGELGMAQGVFKIIVNRVQQEINAMKKHDC